MRGRGVRACAGRAGAPAAGPRPAAAPVGPSVPGARIAPNASQSPDAADSPAALAAGIDSLLADPQWAGAQWGVLVVNPRTGDTLYARNAGKLFIPASNQKIITGAVALANLGPEYRWRTAVAAARGAARPNGTLQGDLYVLGSGDPTVSAAMQHGDAMGPIRALADSVWARGIRRVTGDVVASDGSSAQAPAAGGRPGDPSAAGPRVEGPWAEGPWAEGPWKFGWEWDDLDTPSGAGVTELLFNDGVARAVVFGGPRVGAGAHVAVRPTPSAVPVDEYPVDVRTIAAGTTAGPAVQARWDYDARRYAFRGAIPANDSVVLELGIHDPRRAYAGALRNALRARGVAVQDAPPQGTLRQGRHARGATADARCRDGCAPAPPPLDTLAVITSAPLRDVLPAMEKPSQNQIAEALFLTLGRVGAGSASGDSARRVVGDRLRAWGVEPERDAVVRDGSGLSRHDFVTPRALVRVLDEARRLSDGTFPDALPIAGVDGTLAGRLRGTPAAGRVRAKTGSVDRVRSLSGYATTADDELVIFSVLCNNYTAPSAAVTRVQDAIALRIAMLRARGPAAAAARR